MAKEKMHKVIPETYPNKSVEAKVKVYPTFRLGDDDLPELKDWEVGKKYVLVMEVEMKSKQQGNEWNDSSTDKQIRASFKITNVGVETDDDYESEYANRMSKK